MLMQRRHANKLPRYNHRPRSHISKEGPNRMPSNPSLEYGLWYALDSIQILGLFPNPSEPRLPRCQLGRLHAARSHYKDFASYHERFSHEDALLNCGCGRPKTPVHFYFCQRGRKATPRHLRHIGVFTADLNGPRAEGALHPLVLLLVYLRPLFEGQGDVFAREAPRCHCFHTADEIVDGLNRVLRASRKDAGIGLAGADRQLAAMSGWDDSGQLPGGCAALSGRARRDVGSGLPSGRWGGDLDPADRFFVRVLEVGVGGGLVRSSPGAPPWRVRVVSSLRRMVICSISALTAFAPVAGAPCALCSACG